MRKTQARPKIGDTRWFVEWCVNLPIDEFGDSDVDAAEYDSDDFATETQALAKARRVFPLDAFGSVRYWPATFTRYGWDDGDAKHYEGKGN
jgi:hypothetical protein